jgi:putative pyruvate formate lyase activating enzyme
MCGINRINGNGFCKAAENIRIAKAIPFLYEEPVISGTRGSGAVFFSGCSLKCCYCQNHEISSSNYGSDVSVERFCDILLSLQDKGVHNINLITPTHYSYQIIKALDRIKNRITIPIVYNTGGYERYEIIRLLKDYIDIYLPDLKYYDPYISKEYSDAYDYFEYASAAIQEMVIQKPNIKLDENGILQEGVIIRHMVLPGYYRDSIKLLDWISENLKKESNSFYVSLMRQYTPYFKSSEHPLINRKLTAYEYSKVTEKAAILNLQGFYQKKGSSDTCYIPTFDLEGII